jgi:ABC-2 type transport system ATP-binding protein
MTEDRTLIISTHQVHDVESLLDHILILDNSKLLLNESIANITENYSFTFRQPSEMDESVIYSEPSLQGNAVIAKRQEDENETQLNLELLFNAVTKGLIK